MVEAVESNETLSTVKRRFMEARDMTAEARRDCEIDDDYFHGYQWTPDERRALALRKQPDTTNNCVRQAVLGILGVLKQGRTDPKAWGRNPNDDETADTATKVLRYLSDKAEFAGIRMEGATDYLTKGTCAAIVEGDPSGKVPVTQIRWEEFFYDPRARRKDLKDARYMGIAKWIYADALKRLYPDAGDVDNAIDAWGSGPLDPSFMDRPHSQAGQWYDKKLRRVMLVEMYYNDNGTWQRCVFYSNKMLEEGPSPYLDMDGKPSNPIEAQSCFVDRDNNRYGVVRDMRPLQDEVNKRHSKLLHILNNRQVFAENEIALNASAETVRTEAGRPDGVLPIGWKPVTMNDTAAMHLQLLETAKMDIQRLAPNPAILGRLGNEESGKAQLVRQNAGLTELAVVLGGIESWELRIYRQMWARARQFWTAPDYVRVTDDAGAPQYVGINQPQYGPPQVGMDPASGMPAIVKPVLGYKNALGEMDVDITLDTTPHVANVEQEQFMALVDLRRAGVPIDPILLLQASSLPGKTKIIEEMRKQAEQPNPQAQMQQAAMVADIQDKQAGAAHKNAQAQHLQVRTAIEAQAPQNDLFKAGVMAGMQQAQMQSDRALAKQELVANQLDRLASQARERDAQKAANG